MTFRTFITTGICPRSLKRIDINGERTVVLSLFLHLIAKSVFVGVCVSNSWGKPFWRRVLPQTPFLNLLLLFRHKVSATPYPEKVVEFRKKSLRENAPKRIPTVARYAYCGKSEFIGAYLVHSWVSSSEKIFLRTLL